MAPNDIYLLFQYHDALDGKSGRCVAGRLLVSQGRILPLEDHIGVLGDVFPEAGLGHLHTLNFQRLKASGVYELASEAAVRHGHHLNLINPMDTGLILPDNVYIAQGHKIEVHGDVITLDGKVLPEHEAAEVERAIAEGELQVEPQTLGKAEAEPEKPNPASQLLVDYNSLLSAPEITLGAFKQFYSQNRAMLGDILHDGEKWVSGEPIWGDSLACSIFNECVPHGGLHVAFGVIGWGEINAKMGIRAGTEALIRVGRFAAKALVEAGASYGEALGFRARGPTHHVWFASPEMAAGFVRKLRAEAAASDLHGMVIPLAIGVGASFDEALAAKKDALRLVGTAEFGATPTVMHNSVAHNSDFTNPAKPPQDFATKVAELRAKSPAVVGRVISDAD